MALIKCPECGKEISDKAPACPNCGCPISVSANATKEEENNQAINKVKKHRKPGVIIACVVCLLAAVFGIYFAFFSQTIQKIKEYSAATSLMNNGEYEQALPRFRALDNYRDSQGAIAICLLNIGKQEMQNGNWAQAIACFTECDTSNCLALVSECNYHLGLEAQEKGSWTESIGYFEASGFSDSEEQIKKSKYHLGIEAMDSHDWETASLHLTGLSFEESDKMLTDCSFMIALKESVSRRMEINAKEKSDLRTLVNTELAYLQSYKRATFFDKTIASQAKAYLEGLDKQLKAFDKEYEYEYQIAWQEGLVKRYEALSTLYQKYGFMADNKDFVGTYVSQLSSAKDVLNGYCAIEADLGKQYKDSSIYKKSGYNFILALKNNTKYTFTSTWEFTVYDKNDAKIQTTPVTVSDIKPGQAYEVRFYYSGAWGDIRFQNYYGDIKKGS